MRVTIESQNFAVEFEHRRKRGRTAEGVPVIEPGKTESTVCRIRDLDSPSPADGSFPVIAEAEARCNPRDGFSKEKGRRLALSRALDVFVRHPACWKEYKAERREVRRGFWDAYWKTKAEPLGSVAAVAVIRVLLRTVIEAEEAEIDASGAGTTDFCGLIRALDPILELAGRGRISTDVKSLAKMATAR